MMKKTLFKLILLGIIFFAVSFSASAQIYVKLPLLPPVIIRTPPPSPLHIWIADEWDAYQNSYRYSGSHWEAPPHPGDRWMQGHWKRHHRHQHEWIHGNWKGR